MNSKELNEAIDELCAKEPLIYASSMGGKLVPYIGWFWRNVNFNADYVHLGIVPPMYVDDPDYFEHNPTPKVGFMENNKWDYPEFIVKGNDLHILKHLLITAVKEKTEDAFREVDEFIQSLLPKDYEDGYDY